MNAHGLDDLIESYLDRGMTADEVAREVADVLDALIPLDQLGPAGMVLEMLDGPTILGIVKMIQKCRINTEDRAERRVRRHERRRARRARRESKEGSGLHAQGIDKSVDV